jgi:hypothetical protein
MMVRIPLPNRFKLPTIIGTVAIIITGIILLGVHRSVRIVALPDGSATDAGSLVVSGRAAGATVSVQGFTITGAPDGSFSHSVTLAPGYNEIRVDATAQSGKTTSETIRVVRTVEPARLVRGESSEPINP